MRNSKAGLLSFVSGLALSGLLFIPTAKAADMPVEPIVEEAQANWYVSLHGGWKFDEDWDDHLDQTHHGDEPGEPVFDIEVNTDDGWRVGGALGYTFNDWFSIEGEVGYMKQDLESALFTHESGDPLTDGDCGNLLGHDCLFDDLGGDISILTGMVNAILGVPVGGRFRPYIGGGVGVAHVNVDASISDLDFHLDDSDNVFAAQAFAGLDIGITDNIAIGGRGRWLHVSDIDLTDDEDHDHSIDPDGIVSAEVVLTFAW